MSLANLEQNLALLEKQLFWLDYSYQQTQAVDLARALTIDEINHFENLCSRFARSIDFLVRRVFRSIDDAEFENQGTLVDVVNNAHKRKLFASVDVIRTLKELRNEIVHEYVDEGLSKLFAETVELTPELIKIINNTIAYAKPLLTA